MVKSKKGSKKSMKRGKSTMGKKSTMRKKGKKVAVGMRPIYNKGIATVPFYPPRGTRHFGLEQDDMQPYKPQKRGEVHRTFNRLSESGLSTERLKDKRREAKSAAAKKYSEYNKLANPGIQGQLVKRMQEKLQNGNTFPQKKAKSTIRSANKSLSKLNRSNNASEHSLSWDARAAMPLSSPPQSPCVVTKYEITINSNSKPKESLGIGLVTDNGIVIVTYVKPGSLGAKNGIEVNDVIVAVNDTIIKGHGDVVNLIKTTSKVKLLVYRIQ